MDKRSEEKQERAQAERENGDKKQAETFQRFKRMLSVYIVGEESTSTHITSSSKSSSDDKKLVDEECTKIDGKDKECNHDEINNKVDEKKNAIDQYTDLV